MKNLSFLIIAVTLLIGLDYVGAWTAPTNNPPNQNVAAPVHTGTAMQYKSGVLQAQEFMGRDAVSSLVHMLSPKYCDLSGNNCLNWNGDYAFNQADFNTVNADKYCNSNGNKCFNADDIETILANMNRSSNASRSYSSCPAGNPYNSTPYRYYAVWVPKTNHGVTVSGKCGYYPNETPCYSTSLQSAGTYECDDGTWREVVAPQRTVK